MLDNGEESLRWLVERRGMLDTYGRASMVGTAVEQMLHTIIARYGNRYGLQPDETLARWRTDGTLRIDAFG